MHKIGFLYLRAFTQIYHSIGFAIELSRMEGVEVTLLVSCEANRALASRLNEQGGGRCRVEMLGPGWLHQALRAFKKRIVPKIRVVLRRHRRRLHQFDVLVNTNRFSVRRRADGGPLQVLTGHGAGDREQGFFPETAEFDLVLVPGEEFRARLLERGLVTDDSVRVVGYPKFESVRIGPQRPPPEFDAERPVVLYNPHFDRDESSWHAWGESLLEWFVQQREYNLIFAPHTHLFAKVRDPLPRRFREAGNIHIDVDSCALVDMTYTTQADIYLGDVSSQVYEFVAWKPRPCVFLDVRGMQWRGKPEFRMWRMGPVVTDPANLGAALAEARADAAGFDAVQRELVRDTFSMTDEPASLRGARAIRELLERAAAGGAGPRAARRSGGW